ncbi:MAG: hypothetical protein GJ677_15115 [Rhodobacteraceae bacterium]|nr:hypothetical protein [Paracoccaceae bacterium]
MNTDSWLTLVRSEGFWGGVLASILAAIILGIAAFIFRNTLRAVTEQRKQSREESQVFDEALKLGSPFAPFAFGVAQGRALRYFVVAVFIAYIGDILGIFWPLNIAMYCFSLVFLFQSLRWFYRIEDRAKQILKSEQK